MHRSILRPALPAFAALFLSAPAAAQVATAYAFTQSAGSYTEITGGTLLWGGFLGSFDDNVSGAQTIPSFNYDGTAYTTMYVSANGYITFGAAPAGTDYTPLSSLAAYAGAIAAFGADLQNRTGFNTRDVRWQTVSGEVVIQWRGVRRYNLGSENFNFQIRLNTGNGVIRFIYGSLGSLNSGLTSQPEVGLRGPDNTFATNVNNRLVGTGAENWNTSLAGTANNSQLRFTNAAPAKSFTNGQTYTFTPNCTQPAATPGITMNCTGGTYTVTVVVSGLGSAPNVDITSSANGGVIPGGDDVGTGSYTTPAIPLGTPTTITVVHNGSAACNLGLGTFNPDAYTCPVTTYPHCEDFDTWSTCSTTTNCGLSCTAQEGWTNATGDDLDWRTDFGGTPSSNTGPSTDASGSGNYLYTEASSCFNSTGYLLTRAFDISAMANDPQISFMYHLCGSDMGSLSVQVEDPAGSNSFTTVYSIAGPQQPTEASAWLGSGNILLSGLTGPVVRFRFTGVTGPGFESDMAIDAVCVSEGPSCDPPAATPALTYDCANGTYQVQMTVTDLGDAPNVDLSSSVGGPFADDVGLGTYASAPIPLGTAATITMTHNGNGLCNVAYGPFDPDVVCSGTCLTPTLAVPTNGCGSNTHLDVSIPIAHPGTAMGTDVLLYSVDLIMSSTFNNGDFEVRLISPGGQSRNLMINRFGSGTNIGNPATCPATFLRLIDGGAALTNATTNNASGSYAPEQALAGYTGDPNGLWTLRICDEGILLTGALKFVRLNFVTRGAEDPCAPRAIACGDTRTVNSTAGYPMSLPSGACPFNGAPSSGGVHWWSYTAATTGEVTASTCGMSSFDTRLSVFAMSPTCNALTCLAMNDDTPGCGGNSSEVGFAATGGQTYLIAVHGGGAATGTYTIALTCAAACAPAVGNDQCGSAVPIASVPADGLGVMSTQDNGCAHVDAPTACSGALPVQGAWYSFNSGAFTHHRLTLHGNATNPAYTATALSYAVYAGGCSGMGAAGELGCVTAGEGTTELPLLPTGTPIQLLVYNMGGIGVAGTFGLLLEHPGMNDAGISAVSAPAGLICGTLLAPVVTLKNHGEAPLTSAIIDVSIDAGPPLLSYTWTGPALPYLGTTVVNLPAIATPPGAHVLNVTVHTPNGATDEIAANDLASSAYDASGEEIKVRIVSDNAGAQTTWEIYDAFAFLVESGGPYANNADVTTTHCLPTAFGNTFSFFLYDSFGDGICCGNGMGAWELLDAQGQVMLRDNGQFTTQSPSLTPASPDYINGHEVRLPHGPAAPLASECGVMTNTLQSKVYCTQVAAAGGYQFEFADPDAGYHRRIARPQPWVAFGEMVNPPLTPGVVYFCRMRVDQGLPGYGDDAFGTGCEMAISNTVVPGCTQLIAMGDPAFPPNTWSCGAVRSFGGGDKIWADPVVGGTQYRFQFENVGEGYLRNVLRPNYVCLLNWATLPLQNGSTYAVRVEVLVNGVWSGFCGADCSLTILNPPMGGGSLNSAPMEAMNGVQLWPNPSRDGRVQLLMEGLTDEQQRITVEVFDTYGKRVLARAFDNSGEVFNTVLDLGGDIAAGMYQVYLNVNGKDHMERLAIQ